MDLTEVIKKRRSVRSYLPKEVADNVIEELLEAANLSPSACNKQNRLFVVMKDRETIKRIYEASLKQKHVLEAPVIIAICLDKNVWKADEFIKDGEEWGTDFWGAKTDNYQKNTRFTANWKRWSTLWPIQDCDAATNTFILAATNKGLGTCWIGLFDAEEVRKILKIPDHMEVVSLVTLGYFKDQPVNPGRKPIKDLLHWNKW
jgi:nitroreductase